jgi:hypothetical protein
VAQLFPDIFADAARARKRAGVNSGVNKLEVRKEKACQHDARHSYRFFT